uniref:Uncharacterized protein n=1 Tax=Salix viminalis TaxID=40686 RepID=A0A6N2LG80_SALVM
MLLFIGSCNKRHLRTTFSKRQKLEVSF